jgi:hypothetical protein
MSARASAELCAGDCDGDRQVNVGELIDGVICVLQGVTCVGCCEECLDVDGNGTVSINEIIIALNNALNGCPEPVAFRLTVAVQERPGQTGRARGGRLVLNPLGLVAEHDLVEGLFHFDAVPPGDYELTYSATVEGLTLCNPFGCWAKETPIHIDGDRFTVIVNRVPCRHTGECPNQAFERCVEPGGFAGCGICEDYEDECASDTDCGGSGAICTEEPVPPCPCDGTPALICAPACAGDHVCRDGEHCAADGHCRPLACERNTDCPPHFICGGDDGTDRRTCNRRRCSGADADCGDGGFCVLFECYDERGSCQVLPA